MLVGLHPRSYFAQGSLVNTFVISGQGFRIKASIVRSVLHGVINCWTQHDRAIVSAPVRGRAP